MHPLPDHPWALHRPHLDALLHAPQTAAPTTREPAPASTSRGRTTIIRLHGVIDQHASWFADVSTDAVRRTLRQALAERPDAIVFDIYSPGGGVFGTPELAADIVAARAHTRVVAIANSFAASAAYWIGSAASEFYVTPSGEVGSIGCYLVHADYSRALDTAGITATVIRSGAYKAEGNPYEPLSPAARDYRQASVDRYHTLFVQAVAQQRGVSVATVRETFGEGRMVGARDALRLGMVDGITTLDDLLSHRAPVTTRSLAMAHLDIQRRRLAVVAAGVH